MHGTAHSKIHWEFTAGGAMNKSVYVTVTSEQVRKSFLKAFGEVILAEHLNGGHVPCDVLPEDVGRRIYLFQPHKIAIESAEQQRQREAFFTIHYLCQLLDWIVRSARPEGPFALGGPGSSEVETPWFGSLVQLEE
jgi:hypothetical protein